MTDAVAVVAPLAGALLVPFVILRLWAIFRSLVMG